LIKKILERILAKQGYLISRNQRGEEGLFFHRDFMEDKKALLGNKETLCILDAGAYIGEMALAYRRHFPKARILALEPFPEIHEVLLRRTNGFNIECYKLALADQTGAADLQVFHHAPANSLLTPHPNRGNVWGEGVIKPSGLLPIKTISLEDAFLEFGIQHLDLLKLDVQGLEYKILNGAKEMLKKGRVDFVYLELILMPTYNQQAILSAYLQLMEETGFELHNLYNLSSIRGQLRQVDALFKRSNKP
jgi:FkbM family methyltransferase